MYRSVSVRVWERSTTQLAEEARMVCVVAACVVIRPYYDTSLKQQLILYIDETIMTDTSRIFNCIKY
jgi:hypothetical protein